MLLATLKVHFCMMLSYDFYVIFTIQLKSHNVIDECKLNASPDVPFKIYFVQSGETVHNRSFIENTSMKWIGAND